MLFSGFIFDVEGTLIDCVPQNLLSLQETLKKSGLIVSYEVLQLYSGLDGDQTLRIVAPELDENARKQVLEAEGANYEKVYLNAVKPFPGVRNLFATIKSRGGTLALATDCDGSKLKHYR